MQEKVDQITQWILSYLRGEITEADKQQLDNWIAEHPANQAVWEKIVNEKELHSDLVYLSNIDLESRWEKIIAQVTPVKKAKLISPKWFYLAAAIVVGIAFTVFYFYPFTPGNKPVDKKEIVSKDTLVTPGGDGAVLTLADGSSIILDSVKNGVVAQQGNGNVKVVKLANGQIRYEVVNATGEIEFNILSTRRHEKINIELPDGSLVWLNAASTLKYPTAFTGTERRVELSGEGYFEIKKDQSKPFFVTTSPAIGQPKAVIEVTGTHFNINAYSNEPSINATLLEGRVKVTSTTNPTNAKQLSPGQQAQIISPSSGSANITVVNNADTEQAIAWKNGNFNFDNTDFKVIMRQVERWYDVEVVYEGDIKPRTFNGGTSRSTSIESLLEMLEYMNVHFRREGRKIIVTP